MQNLTPILSSNGHKAIKHTVIGWAVICLNMMLDVLMINDEFTGCHTFFSGGDDYDF